MNASWLGEVFFWVFLSGAAATAAALALDRRVLSTVMGWLSLAAGVGMLAGICMQTGRLPLSGAFESLGYMAFALAALALVSQFGVAARSPLAIATWMATALLLAILIWVPRQVNPDWFLYQYAWTRSFFFCRLSAMSLLLYSALTALSWPGPGKEVPDRRLLVMRSRRFLIAGTALFLVGEVSGFYWCLTWRGDYWLWNRNFLESTLIFLLATASLHLPPKLAARPQALRLAYSLPGLLAVCSYLIHQITGAFL